MIEDNPYKPPKTSGAESNHWQGVGVGRRIFAHFVALVGAVLIFVGGFFVVVGAAGVILRGSGLSSQWGTAVGVLGMLVGLECAIQSYRATLKAQTKT